MFVTVVFHIRVILPENSYRTHLIDEGREELVVNPSSSGVMGWKPLPNEDHIAFRQFLWILAFPVPGVWSFTFNIHSLDFIPHNFQRDEKSDLPLSQKKNNKGLFFFCSVTIQSLTNEILDHLRQNITQKMSQYAIQHCMQAKNKKNDSFIGINLLLLWDKSSPLRSHNYPNGKLETCVFVCIIGGQIWLELSFTSFKKYIQSSH